MAIASLQPLLKTVGQAQSRFLYGLEKTPDERLNWSPSETASTPLQIAGKLAGFLGVMAHMFQERTMPERPPTPPPPPGSREEAKAAITAASGRLQSAIERLSEPDLSQTVTMPWGTTVAIGELIWSVTGVIGYWQGQLNYLQTAYGDMDPNMPPDWGRH
jgi:DinB family protein